MLRVKKPMFAALLALIAVVVSLAGCASLPTLQPNSRIAVVRPYETTNKRIAALGIYSTATLKTPDGRVLCVNDAKWPTLAEMNKRYGSSDLSGYEYFTKQMQLYQEWQKEQLLLKNGAVIALFARPKQETKTSFTGISSQLLGNLMLVAMSAVTKTNAYNTSSGAFVSGATGAYKYSGGSGDAIQTKTETIQQQGYVISTMQIDEKKDKLVWESISCPEEVQNDPWACLSVVALALEAATTPAPKP